MEQTVIPESILAKIRPAYVKSLCEELPALQELSAGAEPTPERLQSLYRTAHNLTSGGTTYGFPSITETGRRLEQWMGERRDASGAFIFSPQDQGLLTILRDFIAACERAIAS